MVTVKRITFQEFKRKFRVQELDPFSTKVFTQKDIQQIQQDFGIIGIGKKLTTIPELLKILFKEPVRIMTTFPKLLRSHIHGVNQFYSGKNKNIKDSYPFSDYVMKASIIGMVNPKKLLEIGTARGWGIATFQSVLPQCKCYTMSPKNTYGANNELPTSEIGKAFRVKKLPVEQIWSDSLKFNYKSFGPVDVSYIDGNHAYKWVYSDLVNCNSITKKIIVLDDYIPSEDAPRGQVLKWGWWNADVVKAVHDFLRKYPKATKQAYWIENTPICVLLK